MSNFYIGERVKLADVVYRSVYWSREEIHVFCNRSRLATVIGFSANGDVEIEIDGIYICVTEDSLISLYPELSKEEVQKLILENKRLLEKVSRLEAENAKYGWESGVQGQY